MTLGQITTRLTQGVARDDLASSYTDIINEGLTEIQNRRSWLGMRSLITLTMAAGDSSVALPTTFKELGGARHPVCIVGTDSDSMRIPVDVVTRERSLARLAMFPWTLFRPRLYLDYEGTIVPDVSVTPITQTATASHHTLSWTSVVGQDYVVKAKVVIGDEWTILSPTLSATSTTTAHAVAVSLGYTIYAVLATGGRSAPVLRLSPPDTATEAITFEVDCYKYFPDLAASTDQNFLTRDFPEMCVAKAKAIAFAAVNDPMAADMESLFEHKFTQAVKKDSFAQLAGRVLRM